jgi:hypothetical protein
MPGVAASGTNAHKGNRMNVAHSCSINQGGKAAEREVIYGSFY